MPKTNKFKILIANQSPLINGKLYSMISGINNISVIGMAENNTEAMTIIEVMKPHAIILDTQQTGNNSIDLLNEIQNKHHQIKVIVFTNRTDSYFKFVCLWH